MKYPYLTKNNKEQYTLPVNVPSAHAEKVSKDVARIVKGAPSEIRGMAGAVRWWIGQFKHIARAQARIDHALELCDEMAHPDYRLADVSWQQVKIIRMALLGCPTATTKDFTGELSQEYIERYGDDD